MWPDIGIKGLEPTILDKLVTRLDCRITVEKNLETSSTGEGIVMRIVLMSVW